MSVVPDWTVALTRCDRLPASTPSFSAAALMTTSETTVEAAEFTRASVRPMSPLLRTPSTVVLLYSASVPAQTKPIPAPTTAATTSGRARLRSDRARPRQDHSSRAVEVMPAIVP